MAARSQGLLAWLPGWAGGAGVGPAGGVGEPSGDQTGWPATPMWGHGALGSGVAWFRAVTRPVRRRGGQAAGGACRRGGRRRSRMCWTGRVSFRSRGEGREHFSHSRTW